MARLSNAQMRRADGVTVSEMDGDLFLIRPESGEIFHLDAIASAIWNALVDSMTMPEMLDLFRTAFPDEASEKLARDVNAVVETMIEGNLIIIA